MRLDRFLCLTIGRFLRTAGKIRIPILMYHSISEKQKFVKHPYFSTTTSPSVFNVHLDYLSQHHYKVIKLSQIPEYLNQTNSVQKVAAITFDDGYMNFYENALPLLKKNDFSATMYVPSGLIDEKENRVLEDLLLMNWNQLRECLANNIEIGSHSLTHGVLVNKSRLSLEKELKNSKEILEQKLDAGISTFAYPYRFPAENSAFIEQLKAILQGVGYKTGVTTNIGLATKKSNCLILSRIPANEYDDLQLFAAKLNGYYDFLSIPQILFKKLKNKVHKLHLSK